MTAGRSIGWMLVLVASCGGAPEQERRTVDPSVPAPASAPVAAPAAPASPTPWVEPDDDRPIWFEASRALDVSGDGVPDTLRLVARGTHPDSLGIRLTVVLQADTLLVGGWSSDYALIDPPDSVTRSASARANHLRSLLREALEGATTSPTPAALLATPWRYPVADPSCENDVPSCIAHAVMHGPGVDGTGTRADSARIDAVLADLRAHATVEFTVSYGYETTETRLWSPLAGRFFVIRSCC